jgi:putative oxygen-independent coproporphyrinogen III oxidase
LSALHREIRLYEESPPFGGLVVSSLYIGGGTPSLLSPGDLTPIMSQLRTSFVLSPDAEITLEGNPGTVVDRYLEGYQKLGVNRLSLGIQSFQDEELSFLRRIHNVRQARRSFCAARKVGFDQIGVDLLFALPGQTMDSWQSTLDGVIELEPDHISLYALTLEPGTPLTRAVSENKIARCDEGLEREMFVGGKEKLENFGFVHYEISNFARMGKMSRHNLMYWDGHKYAGLGPSAHSYDGDHRWWNVADVMGYCEKLENGDFPVQHRESLSDMNKKIELLMLGLRKRSGINPLAWKQLTGTDLLAFMSASIDQMGGIDATAQPFAASSKHRFFTTENGALCLTLDGLLLYDSICVKLAQNIG